MKKVIDNVRSLAELSTFLEQEVDAAFLRFLVERIGYTEVRLTEDGQGVTFPGYVPVGELFREVLRAIKEGEISLRRCRVCAGAFDIDTAEGIFGDDGALDRFVCRPCAEGLSAWDFYQLHLVT
jgi:hypothetical protein